MVVNTLTRRWKYTWEETGSYIKQFARTLPQQNGVAERMNLTLVDNARWLENSKHTKKFRVEAVSTAAYLINRSPAGSLESVMLEEARSIRKPALHHLKMVGSNSMIHVPMQPKAGHGIFVGYAKKSKASRSRFLRAYFVDREC